MKYFKKEVLTAVLCSLLSIETNAAVSNPASTNYVDKAVQNAINQTTYTAGTGISIIANVISQVPTYTVGQVAQGGVVVYVDETGKHGLVAALEDLAPPSSTTFYPYFNPSIYGSTQSASNMFLASFPFEGIGNGYANTINALALASSLASQMPVTEPGTTPDFSNSAGYVPAQAANYNVTYDGEGCTRTATNEDACLGNWYVPDMNEMAIVYNALCTPGTPYQVTTTQRYWTSTQPANQPGNMNVTSANGSCPVSIGGGSTDFIAVSMASEDTVYSTRFVRQF